MRVKKNAYLITKSPLLIKRTIARCVTLSEIEIILLWKR